MSKRTRRKRKSTFGSALLLGIIFGILLVMFQELLYQYRLMAQYEETLVNDYTTDVTLPEPTEEPSEPTPPKFETAPETGPITDIDTRPDFPGGLIKPTEPEPEDDPEPEPVPDTGLLPETEPEPEVLSKISANYDYNEDTKETLITVDDLSIKINFDKLASTNSDFVGWVVIPDTDISFPVVQGDDNAYYLKHDYEGQYKSSGTIFADCRNTLFTDENTILYGHNRHNYTIMFSQLVYYSDQSYYEEHPYAYFLTETGGYRIDIFSAYETPTTDPVYTLTFANNDSYAEFLVHLMKTSMIESQVEVSTEDQLMTLSTCSNIDSEGRFVLIGKMEQIVISTPTEAAHEANPQTAPEDNEDNIENY